jgi:peptidoglycan hydrolase-like protein with peptidoglycan-binding domain
MKMILRKGTKGNEVKELQKILGIASDGDFGQKTEAAVKKWQTKNGLTADGIVGSLTWFAMSVGSATTDIKESIYETKNLIINRYMLPKDEYMTGSRPEYVFLHHTAGWNNPFKTIDHWAGDTRGQLLQNLF